MAFRLSDSWVWDFWLADEGDLFHIFFLHAPRSLGDAELRHRNARIGHATSRDLISWQAHGLVVTSGAAGEHDESATWTGSVVRGPDQMWRMFYTGSRFLAADSEVNIESICVATSSDLYQWTKRRGAVLSADRRWYETLGTSSWPEEAWRDPWVFPDPAGHGWHMIITARANHGDDAGRGIVGHAVSTDLDNWRACPPLSAPQQGFAHLEVPQVIDIDGRTILVFSCNSLRLTNTRRGQRGGVWIAPAESIVGPFATDKATLLVQEPMYSGRIVRDRSGRWVLLAFEMGEGANFVGSIADPIPLVWDPAAATVKVAVAATS